MNHLFKTTSQKGIATIELAIIAPFILFFILGAIEITRYSLFVQYLSSISREAAIAGFRECPTQTIDWQTEGLNVSSCLRELARRIEHAGGTQNSHGNQNTLVNEFGVIISAIDASQDATNPILAPVGPENTRLLDGDVWVQSKILQRFNNNEFDNTNSPFLFLLVLTPRRQIVSGEVFAVYEPLFNFIPFLERQVIYENTII